MIFESKKRANNNLAEWVLDTDRQTVMHTDVDGNVTTRSFYEDCVAYHLKYRAEENPDSLQKLVDEGEILNYLDDSVNRQTDLFLSENKEYQIAVEKSDLYAIEAIGNMARMSAQHEVFDTMVYV